MLPADRHSSADGVSGATGGRVLVGDDEVAFDSLLSVAGISTGNGIGPCVS